jgi:hypothetical protein
MKLLSFAAGAGLMIGSLGTAYAQECQADASAGTSGSTEKLPAGQCEPGVRTNETTGQGPSRQGNQPGAAGDIAGPPGLVSAYRDFMAMTNQHWSLMGFSSAEQARQVLGGDWYADLRFELGLGS